MIGAFPFPTGAGGGGGALTISAATACADFTINPVGPFSIWVPFKTTNPRANEPTTARTFFIAATPSESDPALMRTTDAASAKKSQFTLISKWHHDFVDKNRGPAGMEPTRTRFERYSSLL